jgi:endonuclease YncB( thermonuclease family)
MKLNHLALVTAAVLGGVLLVTARAQQTEISGPARVHDGDTLVIHGTHIRLQGLDAEELSMTNGPKSRAVMQDIVGDSVITCKPDGTRSYQRVVASCSCRTVPTTQES